MTDYFIRDVQALFYAKDMIPKIRELSAPLFTHTMLTNFSYLRFNKDGTVLNLTSEEKWIEFRFTEKIKYKILFQDYLPNAKYNVPYVYLWPNNTTDRLLGALHEYNIWNGCNIYIANPDHIEVFSFASSIENDGTQNFCMNNLDLLKMFILCIKEQILNLPGVNRKTNHVSTELILPAPSIDQKQSINHFDNFYTQDKPRRIHFNEDFYLTLKEMECCAYLMRGMSIKSIAQATNLSPRTVESHINKAKLRANCSSKKILIDYIHSNKWIFESFLSSK